MLVPENSPAIWRTKETEADLAGYEALLAEALKPLLAELVLLNAGVLVTCICNGHESSIADLVESSSELTLQPDRLRYGGHADVAFDWGEWPTVTLGLEFAGDRLEAHFRLIFGRRAIGIEVLCVIFRDAIGDHAGNLGRFAAELARARLPG